MKRTKKIVVLMVPVGGEPNPLEIDDHWRAWRRAVGDRSFQMVGVGPGVFIACADDYHGLEAQPNGCGLYGPYFFVRVDVSGHSRSLTDRQLEKCRRYWEARRDKTPPSPNEIDASFQVFTVGPKEYEHYRLARRKEADAMRKSWEAT